MLPVAKLALQNETDFLILIPEFKEAPKEFSNQRSKEFEKFSRGRSSVWLERLPVTQEVEGSSPFGPAGIPQ